MEAVNSVPGSKEAQVTVHSGPSTPWTPSTRNGSPAEPNTAGATPRTNPSPTVTSGTSSQPSSATSTCSASGPRSKAKPPRTRPATASPSSRPSSPAAGDKPGVPGSVPATRPANPGREWTGERITSGMGVNSRPEQDGRSLIHGPDPNAPAAGKRSGTPGQPLQKCRNPTEEDHVQSSQAKTRTHALRPGGLLLPRIRRRPPLVRLRGLLAVPLPQARTTGGYRPRTAGERGPRTTGERCPGTTGGYRPRTAGGHRPAGSGPVPKAARTVARGCPRSGRQTAPQQKALTAVLPATDPRPSPGPRNAPEAVFSPFHRQRWPPPFPWPTGKSRSTPPQSAPAATERRGPTPITPKSRPPATGHWHLTTGT